MRRMSQSEIKKSKPKDNDYLEFYFYFQPVFLFIARDAMQNKK